MSGRVAACVVSTVCLTGAAGVVTGDQPLRMDVTPAVTAAPAFVTVRVTIDAAADNRRLDVVAQSATFYRRSEIPVEGARASRVTVVEFRDLPAGLYEVTSVLVGTRGPRGSALRLVKVESAPGAR